MSTTQVHSCEICNALVPESDIGLGKATRFGKLVLCAACSSCKVARCKSCSRLILEGDMHCRFCGTPQYSSPKPVSPKQEPTKAPQQITQPQLIERTSKKYKAQVLGGIGMVVLGIIIALGTGEDTIGAIVAGLLMLAGIICYLQARILAWWHHG